MYVLWVVHYKHFTVLKRPTVMNRDASGPDFHGLKCALIAPFGRRNSGEMGWSRGNVGKRGVLDSGVFSIPEPSFVFLMGQPFHYQGYDLRTITGN